MAMSVRSNVTVRGTSDLQAVAVVGGKLMNCFKLIISGRIDVISSLDCHAEYSFWKGRDGGKGNEL